MLVIADPSAADVNLTSVVGAPRWAAQMLELTNTDDTNNSDIVIRPERGASDGSDDVTITLVPLEVKKIRYPISFIEATGSAAAVQVVAYWWDPGGSTNWNK